jgi:hypothetical protein
VATLAVPDYTFRQEQGTVHIVLRVRGATAVTSHFGANHFAVTVHGVAPDQDKNAAGQPPAPTELVHMHIATYDAIFPDACHCDVSEYNVVVTLTKRNFGLRWRGITAAVLPEEEDGGGEADADVAGSCNEVETAATGNQDQEGDVCSSSAVAEKDPGGSSAPVDTDDDGKGAEKKSGGKSKSKSSEKSSEKSGEDTAAATCARDNDKREAQRGASTPVPAATSDAAASIQLSNNAMFELD